MIRRIIDSRLPFMAYPAFKVFNLDFFKSVHEAGGLPVIDSEFFSNDQVIKFMRMLGNACVLFGIRINSTNTGLISEIFKENWSHLDALIVYGTFGKDISGFVPHSRSCKIIVEVRDINMTDLLDEISPDAVIIKGLESGGLVSGYTGYVLMQWYLHNSRYPVFMHGGVGMHNAAGMFAAGVSGVVLDSQLYLAEESGVSPNFRKLFETMDELDTILIEGPHGVKYRFFAKLGTTIAHDLKKRESHFALIKDDKDDEAKGFFDFIHENCTSLENAEVKAVQSLFYLGQDASFAKIFSARAKTIKEIISVFFDNIRCHIADLSICDPLSENTELAIEHGTKYPVVQGPMANISESADFAEKIYNAGGLPFYAMGNLPKHIAEPVLEKAGKKNIPFGAGLIGIEVFNKALVDHLDLLDKYKAPFALFAGGTPFQALELEKKGIKTYLHTPSSMILENAIQNGCSRFIFEGTEAGGHVGSLASLVLWELALERVSKMPESEAKKKTLIFAGGISTPAGSHFISGMAASLARKGVKIGIQVGSAYLFTEEIIETGGMTRKYQKEILEKNSTLVIGRTVGLPSRTVASPFSLKMLDREYERIEDGMPLSDRKKAFEHDNMGSLLIGAKGFVPDFKNDPSKYIYFDENEIYEKGNFCVGDSIAFFSDRITIKDIHESYFLTKDLLHKNLDRLEIMTRPDHEIHDEIAVIGMGCVFPDAFSPDELWQNVIEKKSSIRTVPDERLDHRLYFSENKSDEDCTYSRIGGVIENFSFNMHDFGMNEIENSGISRSQQLILTAARQAALSSGYLDKKKLPLNTAVIIASCLGNELTNDLQLKYYTPEIKYELEKLPEFSSLSEEQKSALLNNLKKGLSNNHSNEPPDSAVLNIEASRVASMLNVEGPNYVVDAACATSFAAIECGMRELLSGSCDAVVTGGLNTNLTPEAFIGFSKMGALSAEGSWPFDERASGFVLGEGAGAFILKRMRDAVRDGDKILAVIKGMGASSDGKGKAIAAPNPKGQELALRRCFENAISPLKPEEIGYIEAHGTSTIMGDAAEIETLKSVYGASESVGISSVKSQIGHLLGGAGAAGLIKAVLAVNKGILPPNADFSKASCADVIKDTGIFIIKDAQSWTVDEGKTRKAAISSYGFGGINYHCVIEEYTDSYSPVPRSIIPDIDWDPNGDRIVVAGIGAVLPGAMNPDEFWERLVEGKPVVTDSPDVRFSMDAYSSENEKEYHLPKVKAGVVSGFKFNNVKYKIPPMSASCVDKAQLFGLTAADQAIATSGLSKVLDFGNRVNVVLGTISGNHYVENVLRVRLPLIRRIINETNEIPSETAEKISKKITEVFKKRLPRLSEDTTPGLLSNIVSGRIANFFGCNGANYIIDAACASSAIAIRSAVLGLLSGKSDFAITGGVDANLYPTMFMVFKRLGLLSEKDTRIFDENGSGVVLSEGAAIQVLTTFKKAKEHGMPILAELRSIEMMSKAGENMFSPSASMFSQVIEKAHETAGSCRDDVDHLDVFGFGHYLLDQVEHRSLRSAFRKNQRYGNIKPEFGYFKAANPAVTFTRMILMNMKRSVLAFRSFDKDTSLTRKASNMLAGMESRNLDKGRRAVFAANIFGFGGNHGHIVAGDLPSWMRMEKSQEITAEIQMKKTGSPTSFKLMRNNGLAVLLSGQGAQYKGMLKELYATEPEIRQMLDKAEAIFWSQRGYSILSLMFDGVSGSATADLNSTENTQPAVFLASAAIYSQLEKKGLIADAFIGHSIGEYTALFTSGMLDFETAFRLVLTRSTLMKKASQDVPGEIMAVFQGSDEVEGLIKESGIEGVYIANKNSRKQTVVSGSKNGMSGFSVLLSSKGILYRKLNLSGAFHTPLFESAASGMKAAFSEISFRNAYCGRIISNVTARPYPEDHEEIKKLLITQIVSPVEFIRSVEHLYESGIRNFVEAGSGKILTNLVNDMGLDGITCLNSLDPKTGEAKSFENALQLFAAKGFISAQKSHQNSQLTTTKNDKKETSRESGIAMKRYDDDREFNEFLKENELLIREKLFNEFKTKKMEERLGEYEQFGFYTGKVSIAGVSVGLPGTARHVFESDNFERLLSGQNFIEALTGIEKDRMLDKNITRLVKQSDGNARFQEINSPEDVIQLAGKLGFFDLKEEYGIETEYDITIGLSIAAGIEALKDAGIPLVMNFRETASGAMIPEGLALPSEMQNTTGVILTSLFPGWDTLITEVREYYRQKYFVKPYKEMEKIYYFLMEKLGDVDAKSKITEWFFGVWDKEIKGKDKYLYKREFPANITPLGSAHFARIIKAKGPNIQMSGACASTTQAICVAEDWIRTGRCERVIIIGGEAATSRNQAPWIGSGFLSLGAASTRKSVQEAAKPFDEDRNGTILGAGATSLIVERSDRIKERGLNGQAEILGTKIGNSAFHTTGIDVKHLAEEMSVFINHVEKRHGMDKSEYAPKTVFMSHETFTPARGGSADAEIEALRASYGPLAERITITNTKGYTGHTLGAAIEDAVMVKALQAGKVPPVANLKKIPQNFADLKFSKGEESEFEYGLHLSAGFGSHFAFLFAKKTRENSTIGNPVYVEWLKKISGVDNPVLSVVNKTLCLEKSAPQNTTKTLTAVNKAPEIKTTVSADHERAAVKPAQPEKKSAFNPVSMITSIIAEQTGYSEDMLGEELDLEADLGIDTVKQVEIFGKITAAFEIEIPEGENLRELSTIGKISDFIKSLLPSGADDSKPEKSGAASPRIATDFSGKIKSIIAEQTGYSEDMLEDGLDLEADLGIDTVKQVEIFGKITAAFEIEIPESANLRELNTISAISAFISSLVPEGIEIDEAESVNIEGVKNQAAKISTSSAKEKIRSIISEQTGYSEDMLDDNLDLEADLGIDTVKQVEIFGKITAAFAVEIPEGANLRELSTISLISEFIEGLIPYSSMSETLNPEITVQAATERSMTRQDKITEKDTANKSYSKETADIIKGIISEQTGYLKDLLDENLDLESGLGIDSVKQVDILSMIMRHFGDEVYEQPNILTMKTIADLASFIDSSAKKNLSLKNNTNGHGFNYSTDRLSEFARNFDQGSKTLRFVYGIEKTEKSEKEVFQIKGKTLLVTLDDNGISQHVITALRSKGANIITIGQTTDAEIKADFMNPEKMSSVMSKLAGIRPEISGIVHLNHLGSNRLKNDGDNQVKAFFSSVKALIQSENVRIELIAMPSFNSVLFHESAEDSDIDPVCAGLSGFLKTVAREMPQIRVKVVDFAEKDDSSYDSSDSSIRYMTERFVREMLCEDTRVETGYIGDQKYVPVLKPLRPEKEANMLESANKILVTGGAGGITYEILKSIVSDMKKTTGKPSFVITGRSDYESLDEEIKSADSAGILAIMKKRMPGSKPVEIKKAVEKITRTLKTRDNVLELTKLGAKIHYHSADVTDSESLSNIVSNHPDIDGLIHAAGVEESQAIIKKTDDSFSRVFDTKIKGFRNLMDSLSGKSLKFIIGFSSVTARFGNAGQSDYTAANDMLGKLIMIEKIKRPDLLVKIMDWTAWEGAGMATNETVRKVLTSRGLTFLPMDEGIRHFKDEISDSSSCEVVFSGPDRNFDPDGLIMGTSYENGASSESDDRGMAYFIDDILEKNEDAAVFSRCLDIEKDLFLLDHSMSGTPIFLGATGIETMAEAAALTTGQDLTIREMTDFAIPYGIKILKKRPVDLEIRSEKNGQASATCSITSKVVSPGGHVIKQHYKGSFHFGSARPEPEFIKVPSLPSITWDGDLGGIIYTPTRLFMDGLFRTITSIEGFDGETLVTRMSDTSDRQFFSGTTAPAFLTPVVLIDAMFQTGGLFNMMSTDELVLPFGIEKMSFLDSPERFEECLCITRKTGSNKKTDTFDLMLTSLEGRIFVRVKGFEMVKIAKLESRKSIKDRFKTAGEKKAS